MREPPMEEQFLDPRVLANFLEALWCLGQGWGAQAAPPRGRAALGHTLGGWQRK